MRRAQAIQILLWPLMTRDILKVHLRCWILEEVFVVALEEGLWLLLLLGAYLATYPPS